MIRPRIEHAAASGAMLLAAACLTDPATYGAGDTSTSQSVGGGGSTSTDASTSTSSVGGGSGAGGSGGAPSTVFEWVVPLQGDGDQIATSLATTLEGDTYVVGAWEGALQGPGVGTPCALGRHAFVQKVDDGGARVWARCFGDDAIANAVDVTSDGGVAIVGTFSGSIDVTGVAPVDSAGGTDAFVVVLSATGDIVWGRTFGSTKNDTGTGVAVTTGAPLYVAGAFRGTMALGTSTFTAPVGADLFLAKVAATSVIWARQLDNGSGAPSLHLAAKAGSPGPIVGAGAFQGTLDPDGPGPVAAATAIGEDAFAIGYDNAGAITFFHAFGGAGAQRANSIQASTATFLIGGDFSNTVDFDGDGPLAALTADDTDAFLLSGAFVGTFESVAQVGGSGAQHGFGAGLSATGTSEYAVVGDFSGQTILNGATYSASAPARDGFIATFVPQTTLESSNARVIGPGGGALTVSAARGQGRGFVIAGQFAGDADLGGPITAQGGLDAFVAKLVP